MEWPLSFDVADSQMVLQWIDRVLDVEDLKIQYQHAYDSFQKGTNEYTISRQNWKLSVTTSKAVEKRQALIEKSVRLCDGYLVIFLLRLLDPNLDFISCKNKYKLQTQHNLQHLDRLRSVAKSLHLECDQSYEREIGKTENERASRLRIRHVSSVVKLILCKIL